MGHFTAHISDLTHLTVVGGFIEGVVAEQSNGLVLMLPDLVEPRLAGASKLPKPGYVLASALVLGMVVGFSTTPQDSAVNETNAQSASSFLAGDEGLL